ncbi:MAG TPA: transcriptional regulator [Pirellulales bacterium]|nr:transcriptional regulator [Pirellulales bacterium]
MSRSPTADVYNALAESRQRQIVELLAPRAARGKPVVVLNLPRPAAAKHLYALCTVGLVVVIQQGRRRVDQLQAERPKTVHDWGRFFEELWNDRLHRIKERAEHRARTRQQPPIIPKPRKGKP